MRAMAAISQGLSAAAISDTRAVLLEQHVHAGGLQCCDHKVVALVRISQQHISGAQRSQETAKDIQLACSFA